MTSQQKYYNQQIYIYAQKKVNAEKAKVDVTMNLKGRKELWGKWSDEFEVICSQQKVVESTALDYRTGAKTYKALVANALAEFDEIISSRQLLGEVEWDEMDTMGIKDKAQKLSS